MRVVKKFTGGAYLIRFGDEEEGYDMLLTERAVRDAMSAVEKRKEVLIKELDRKQKEKMLIISAMESCELPEETVTLQQMREYRLRARSARFGLRSVRPPEEMIHDLSDKLDQAAVEVVNLPPDASEAIKAAFDARRQLQAKRREVLARTRPERPSSEGDKTVSVKDTKKAVSKRRGRQPSKRSG
jgi:hypothetical protein